MNLSQQRQAGVESEIPIDALRRGSEVFDDWFAENENQISEMGGCDSHSMLAALWAAWKNLR